MESTRAPLIDRTAAARSPAHGQPAVRAVVVIAGLFMLVSGVWAFAAPRSFATFVDFPYHRHFLHDLGAFQIGIGATLLLALWWRDAIAVALAGFVVGTVLHALSHLLDINLGGRSTDWLLLAVLSLIAAAALVARRCWLRQTAGVTPPLSPDQTR